MLQTLKHCMSANIWLGRQGADVSISWILSLMKQAARGFKQESCKEGGEGGRGILKHCMLVQDYGTQARQW